MVGTSEAQGPAPIGAVGTLADHLLRRAADATFLVDVETGLAVQTWHDPGSSRVRLSQDPLGERLIEWVHPDDLTDVLASFAAVMNTGTTRAAMARIHPDRVDMVDAILLIRIQQAGDPSPGCALVQVFVADSDQIASQNHDPATSLSSLAAVAPVGLQVLGLYGNVNFENERFTLLAADGRDDIQMRIARAADARLPVTEDLNVGSSWLRLRVVPTLDDEGRLVHTVASLEDVTQVQVAEAGRKHAEELFEAVFHSSPMATALVGLDGSLVKVNEPFAAITGYTIEELEGTTFQAITHPADLAADEELLAEVRSGTRPGYQMEKRYIHRAGHDVWVELSVAPVKGADGEIEHYVSHVEDVTSRRSAIELGDADDLTYWATHDHLTGLPNRRFVEHHLQVRLARARRADDSRPVVMFLDLDDFKPVNDVHGHLVGDDVLRTVSRRLRRSSRDDTIVARYGGDEFIVVAHRLRTVDDVPILVERLHSAIREPIQLADGTVIEVGASVGISIAREDETAEQLIARADAATYRAKRDGKNKSSYDSA